MLSDGGGSLFPERYNVTVSYEMKEFLKSETKRRCLPTPQDTIRMIISEYIAAHPQEKKPSETS
jgi:hypothetical protein